MDNLPEGLRVLLVNDDSSSLTLLENSLKDFKYEVTCTSSAEDAGKILDERKELIECDLKVNLVEFVEVVYKMKIRIMVNCGEENITKMRSAYETVGAAVYTASTSNTHWDRTGELSTPTTTQQQH